MVSLTVYGSYTREKLKFTNTKSAFLAETTFFDCRLGSSINDVTVVGGRGDKGFVDDSTKALVIKCGTRGGGQKWSRIT